MAAQIYDALEAARLDALGAAWLPGVATNLLADVADEQTLMQWLAFEALANRGPPATIASGVTRVAAAMPAALRPGLSALAPLVVVQPAFAATAAQWAHAAAAHPWAAAAMARAAASVSSAGEARVAQHGAGTTSVQARGDRFNRRVHAAAGGAARATRAPENHSTSYHAYTTAHDRVVDAASLARPSELATLRARLDAELGETRLAATRLANRLRRMLMARQARSWRFDLDEGVLDGRRLAGLIAAPGDARPFKAEAESRLPRAAVTLLVDCSGSMRGRPILIAALTVELMIQALERCGIVCEVLGFTTRDWDGGHARAEWLAAGAPANPGRLAPLEHIVLKSADVPWRRARHGLGLVLRDELLKENIDGEAVQWAHARLRRRAEPRKLLLVVSDGEPHDEATEQANGRAYLARHLRAVADDIDMRSPVEIAAIGVGHDVRRFYSRAASIASADDLAAALSRSLTAFFAAPAQPRKPARRAVR